MLQRRSDGEIRQNSFNRRLIQKNGIEEHIGREGMNGPIVRDYRIDGQVIRVTEDAGYYGLLEMKRIA